MKILKNIWNKIRNKKEDKKIIDEQLSEIKDEKKAVNVMSCEHNYYEADIGYMCDVTKTKCICNDIPQENKCDIYQQLKPTVDISLSEDTEANNKRKFKLRYTTLRKCFYLRMKRKHYKLKIDVNRLEEIINEQIADRI